MQLARIKGRVRQFWYSFVFWCSSIAEQYPKRAIRIWSPLTGVFLAVPKATNNTPPTPNLILIYSQFHKTLPKSSLQMHWISVRFYEMGDNIFFLYKGCPILELWFLILEIGYLFTSLSLLCCLFPYINILILEWELK